MLFWTVGFNRSLFETAKATTSPVVAVFYHSAVVELKRLLSESCPKLGSPPPRSFNLRNAFLHPLSLKFSTSIGPKWEIRFFPE